MYKRKTKDEWHIKTNYGYGWETECIEETFKDARLRFKEYLNNAQGLRDIKIVLRRSRLNEVL